MVWGYVPTSLIPMQMSSFANIAWWRDCLLSTVYPCLLCRSLLECRHVALLLGSRPVPLIHLSVSVSISHCFAYRCSAVLSEVCEVSAPVLFFFRIALALLGVSWVYINFMIIGSSSVENVKGNLTGISQSVDCLRQNGHLTILIFPTQVMSYIFNLFLSKLFPSSTLAWKFPWIEDLGGLQTVRGLWKSWQLKNKSKLSPKA